MKTVQMTEIYSEYGEMISQDKIDTLNKDLKAMFGSQVAVVLDNQDDGFLIKFYKEKED